ncbi:MAG: T9SS type A sorting domain-containing protein [Candidatus Kapabacteria bacterium]|nr:T9SS type A sorting domain-containing protein [Candidatus Kapabacteria bacterium]
MRERKDLLSDDEVRTIVRLEAQAVKRESRLKQSITSFGKTGANLKKSLLYSIPLLSGIALMLLWLSLTKHNTEAAIANYQASPLPSVTTSPNSTEKRLHALSTSELRMSNLRHTNKQSSKKSPVTTDISLNTTGIHFLELTSEEAQRFGLLLTDTILKSVYVEQGMTVQSADKNEVTEGSVLKIDYTENFTLIDLTNEIPKELRFENAIKASPFLVTSSHKKDGIMQQRMTPPELDSLSKHLNSAIALGFDVRKNKSSRTTPKNWGGYVVLWYHNTPETRSALPDRYRVPLERELAAAAKYSSLCEIPTREEREELEQIIAGKPFLETWRSCSGALTAKNISPNPAQNDVTTRFVLTAPRTVSAALHDIRGVHLETLTSAQNLSAGEHQLSLTIARHPAGMYLLVLTTPQGEQTVQRVMIEK